MRSCYGRTFKVEGGGMKTQRRRYNYVTRIQAVAPQRWRVKYYVMSRYTESSNGSSKILSHWQFYRPTANQPSSNSKSRIFAVVFITATPETLGFIITDQERNSDLRLLTLEYVLHFWFT
jgi:hypothetical protein